MPTASQAARSVASVAASLHSMRLDERQHKAMETTRYAYVGPVVNTGRTAKQAIKKIDCQPRHGEIFKRMSSKELYDLMHDHPDPTESIFQLDEGRDQMGRETADSACKLGHPSSSNVVSVEKSSDVEGAMEPFLLLDLRSVQEFDMAHIRKARSYSSLEIRRDKMTVEITRFKQDQTRPIVVYSNSKKEATDIGTLLIQKHFPNVFVLSSSFEKYAIRFPDDVDGDVPKPPQMIVRKRQPLNVYVPRRVHDDDAASQARTGSVRGAATSVLSSTPWRPA